MSRVYAYEVEPYRSTLEVEVLDFGEGLEGPYAVVTDSILFPGGGGQPADSGTLAGVTVLSSVKTNEGLRMILAAPVSGGSATVDLDWPIRFDRMQQHTAQHLLSAVAADQFGWTTTSFHLADQVCDIELDVEFLDAERLVLLEEAVMAHVRKGVRVRARRVSQREYQAMNMRGRGLPADFEGTVRLVELDGVDVTTCGGTHLSSTGEIEAICLLGTDTMRGGTRLRWVAGGRVRTQLREHVQRTRDLRHVLGVADDQLVEAAVSRVEEIKALARAAKGLEGRFAAEAGARLASGGIIVEAHFEDTEPAFLQAVARVLNADDEDRLTLLTAVGKKGLFFLIAAGGRFATDLSEIGGGVAEAIGGRGGGSGRIFQGRTESLENRDRAVALLREYEDPVA